MSKNKNDLSLSTIAKELDIQLVGGTGKETFNGISIDSRTLEPNDIFVALKGPSNDGHDYLIEAKEKGAIALVVEKDISIDKPYILVKDCYKFLDHLAKYQRDIFTGKVIGLTGSNGKTTTKEIIYSMLQKDGCHKTKGNKNNHIGVPLTLSSLSNDYKYAVIEIGTNSPGEISNLSSKVEPDVALILNAAASHLEKLDSVEKVAKEKGYILEHLHKDGIAVLPRDSEFFFYWKERSEGRRIISFGFHQDSDIRLSNIRRDLLKNEISFDINYAEKSIRCFMKGIATHNCLNATGALSVCHVLNIDLEQASVNLSNIAFPKRRMEVKKALKDSVLIDDSYNANPESMKKSLDVLGDMHGKNRIFIAGEMGELGKQEENYHVEICEYALGKVEEFLCIGDLWKEGLKHISDIGIKFSSKDKLLEYLNTKLTKDSIILVKGSRSTGMDYISDKLKV